jgi:hypothetical protein
MTSSIWACIFLSAAASAQPGDDLRGKVRETVDGKTKEVRVWDTYPDKINTGCDSTNTFWVRSTITSEPLASRHYNSKQACQDRKKSFQKWRTDAKELGLQMHFSEDLADVGLTAGGGPGNDGADPRGSGRK